MASFTIFPFLPPCELLAVGLLYRHFLVPGSFFPSLAWVAFFFFFFFWPNLQQMEVPVLGVEVGLQLQAYTTATAPLDPSHVYDLRCRLQQHQILTH